MGQQTNKLVHCRYKQCSKLHDSTELNKEDAVQSGSTYYYHPDCYKTMKTINEIRDLFVREINPAMTGTQIASLVSVINNLIFKKNIDVDYLIFALRFFVKYKPGKLHQPFGLHYIIQDKDVVLAWKKEREKALRKEVKKQSPLVVDEFSMVSDFDYKAPKQRSFADILQ